MKKVVAILIFVFGFLFFSVMEYGYIPSQMTDLVQPLIFSIISAIIFLWGRYRMYILKLSLILLFLMVILYLFNQISPANYIGSLGFGIFVIVIFSYIPKIIRDGHI